MGTFGRLVFCAVRTQIVGKTKFFDSLNTARKSGVFFEAVEGLRQPLARNHAFERILKKNRALRAHFFFPCINSEVHAPGIYEFASQNLFHARFRAKSVPADRFSALVPRRFFARKHALPYIIYSARFPMRAARPFRSCKIR